MGEKGHHAARWRGSERPLLCACWAALVTLSFPAPAGQDLPPLEPVPVSRLVFGGDVMLSRHVGTLAREKKDDSWPFRSIAPFFHSADIAFVNLESPFSDKPGHVTSGMIFKAEPPMIEGLLLAGIDVVSTANNHCRDQGYKGVEFTLDLLKESGIAAAGTGKSAEEAHRGILLDRNGTRFGFLAYTYDQLNGNHKAADDRIATLDVETMRRDVENLKPRADVIIVSMHAGGEYAKDPNADQVRFARAAIDAGATLVVGHHPHVVQPPEIYRTGVILHSLGNLVFDQFQRQETQRGLVAEVQFLGKHIQSVALWPVDIVKTMPKLADKPEILSLGNGNNPAPLPTGPDLLSGRSLSVAARR